MLDEFNIADNDEFVQATCDVWDSENGYFTNQIRSIQNKLVSAKNKGVFEITHAFMCCTTALKVKSIFESKGYIVRVREEELGRYKISIIGASLADRNKIDLFLGGGG